jgi:hypothetical protein
METFVHDYCIASYWYGRRNILHQITQHTYTGMRKNASLKGKRKRTLSHATDHSRGQKKKPTPKTMTRWEQGGGRKRGFTVSPRMRRWSQSDDAMTCFIWFTSSRPAQPTAQYHVPPPLLQAPTQTYRSKRKANL